MSNLHAAYIKLDNQIYGVIDHVSIFDNIGSDNGIQMDAGSTIDPWGDLAWSKPSPYGTTNELYVEDCTFNMAYINDGIYGCSVVFRHNTIINGYFQAHGLDSSQRIRGTKSFEIYDNTWIRTDTYSNWIACISSIRSGSGVIYSNTLLGTPNMIFGADRANSAFPPFWGANGTDPWDNNNPTMQDSGTASAGSSSGALIDSTKNWTVNQWVGGAGNNTNCAFVIQDVTKGGATGTANNPAGYSLITRNDATHIYTLIDPYGGNVPFATGDTYRIYMVYHMLDQPGMGHGDLLAGGNPGVYDTVTGGTNWPNEISEPIYVWGNTENGGPFAATQPAYNIIILGRDLINGVKPGYTPLVYPHPLVSGNPPPPTYTLTVVNGSGSGSFTAGSIVSIAAGTISGKYFTNWSGLNIANTNAASTTVTMPAGNLTVTANFATAAPTTYTLTVVNGSGSGTFTAGSVINISANTISTEFFTNWSGLYIANTNAVNTTVTMPASSLTVTANYVPYPPTQLIITPGP